MRSGVKVEMLAHTTGFSKAQFPWQEQTAFSAACREAELNLACGAMEYVRDDEASETVADNVVHFFRRGRSGEHASFGANKWTNKVVYSAPLMLPTAGDLEGDEPVCKV